MNQCFKPFITCKIVVEIVAILKSITVKQTGELSVALIIELSLSLSLILCASLLLS